jgi:hypothetical protein
LVAHRSLTLAVLMPLARHRMASDRQSRSVALGHLEITERNRA